MTQGLIHKVGSVVKMSFRPRCQLCGSSPELVRTYFVAETTEFGAHKIRDIFRVFEIFPTAALLQLLEIIGASSKSVIYPRQRGIA